MEGVVIQQQKGQGQRDIGCEESGENGHLGVRWGFCLPHPSSPSVAMTTGVRPRH